MRIALVNSSREPFQSAGHRVRIGSGDDNDVVLAGAAVGNRHLVISEDRRGLVLEVLPGAVHVYVNARPVRERALLRFGDVLSVGGSKLTVLPDDHRRETPVGLALGEQTMQRPGFAALRLVSGTRSGRLLPIDRALSVGAHGVVLDGVALTCKLRLDEDGLSFTADDGAVMVNGRPGKHAKLAPGDQLVLGEHRLVVEAPGLQAEAAAAARARVDAPEAPVIARPRASRAELGWLLGTAALLAAIIAAMLWLRH